MAPNWNEMEPVSFCVKFSTFSFIKVNFSRDYNYWIPAGTPTLPSALPSINLQSKEALSRGRTTFHLSFAGPAQMNIQIVPLADAELVAWSFNNDLIPLTHWKGRDVYSLSYVHGVNDFFNKNYDFSLTFETPMSWSESYTFEITLSAHYHHANQTITKEFNEFVKSFPKWTTLQSWAAYYGAYQF